MPELPEVEILTRHLRPLLRGKIICSVAVRRERILRPTSLPKFKNTLVGSKFTNLKRRGKYLLFQLHAKTSGKNVTVLGHLGMAGRMFVALKNEQLPKHAAVIFDLGDKNFIYEDRRYFGRMALDLSPLEKLGPEPLSKDFSTEFLAKGLKRSRQAIKVKLLDQALCAGMGNIYASESLFRARISPKLAADKLNAAQIKKLRLTIREVLAEAIEFGGGVPLKTISGKSDALFYFSADGESFYEKRLRVYGRGGKPCLNCGTTIRRIVQAARGTFFCPHCQKT